MSAIVVTGAGKGIGFELVRNLAASGHEVIAVSRNLSALESLAIPGVHCIGFDLSSGNYQELHDAIASLTDRVDILVNNAGMLLNKNFGEISLAEMHAVYSVNVFSVMQTIQALMPLMVAAKGSHVVNISSMGGFQGAAKFPGLSVYSSSKAALVCLTECLAEEFRNSSVKFNVLCLGAVQTEMLSAAFPGYTAPLKAVEMAEFIAGFCFQGSKVMNGKVLPVSLSTP